MILDNSFSLLVNNFSWAGIIGPLVVAVIVGVGASFVTTKMQVATLEERLDRTETDIVKLKTQGDQQMRREVELRSRVIRMETKIDLLLEAQGISIQSNEDHNQ